MPYTITQCIFLVLVTWVNLVLASPSLFEIVPGWLVLLSVIMLFLFPGARSIYSEINRSKPPLWLKGLIVSVFFGILIVEGVMILASGVSFLESDLLVRLIFVTLLTGMVARILWVILCRRKKEQREEEDAC